MRSQTVDGIQEQCGVLSSQYFAVKVTECLFHFKDL